MGLRFVIKNRTGIIVRVWVIFRIQGWGYGYG